MSHHMDKHTDMSGANHGAIARQVAQAMAQQSNMAHIARQLRDEAELRFDAIEFTVALFGVMSAEYTDQVPAATRAIQIQKRCDAWIDAAVNDAFSSSLPGEIGQSMNAAYEDLRTRFADAVAAAGTFEVVGLDDPEPDA